MSAPLSYVSFAQTLVTNEVNILPVSVLMFFYLLLVAPDPLFLASILEGFL
ncbi:hypothetical protein BS47DRAFT_1490675 [Hydnum rufescens UP504]|uniref:Uncharacterized protein n=1 Tax=Hydnum rufescens UP504 TaxID=1448309 RepID=A0A9P6AA02_9AGAM|nr:hypothetical protein BS47DRAFT_1490675 [Hydnum rufescens UP504]